MIFLKKLVLFPIVIILYLFVFKFVVLFYLLKYVCKIIQYILLGLSASLTALGGFLMNVSSKATNISYDIAKRITGLLSDSKDKYYDE